MSLGKILIQAREKKGLSQIQVAKKLEVAQSTYSDWESDISIPKVENFLKISEFYDIDLKDLISTTQNISIGNNNTNVITGSNVKVDSTKAILKLADGLEKLTSLVEKMMNEK